MTAIEVRDLRKRFFNPDPVVAVDGVSFTCQPGQVYGLLGPNGAGKTTTLRVLATLLTPESGSALVNGHDVVTAPERVRASIGYLSASTGLYGRLSARELLDHFARLQGVDDARGRVEALLDRFEIRRFADTRCDRLSTGMKQKVNIARAVVHDPPIVILDEPTSGLDVVVAQVVLRFVEESRDAGRCVLYSTHIMSEAERLCDRIAIVHQGSIRAEGSLTELQERYSERYLERIFLRAVDQVPGKEPAPP
jgi:sodium transport system ATP-binding protein